MNIYKIFLIILFFCLTFVIPARASSDMPARLSIPKIKLNVSLESVGITPKGAVGVPKGLGNAGWFNLGTIPGDLGSAVVTGHYGRLKNGKMGVFSNIYKLRKGDKLYVKDNKNVIITFVVREIRKYNFKSNASEVFVSNDDKSHLNLITCVGVWNKATQNYSQRLVVFADKE